MHNTANANKVDRHHPKPMGVTGIWPQALLPNEPRIFNPASERALTQRHLIPALAELEACFLAVRALLDPQLERAQPIKLGKPYPLGQCLEIAQTVHKQLRTIDETSLPPGAAVAGLRALRAFQRAGGAFRLVWGDLRGTYFQNAYQLGTLYVDVSNDTVVTTKPKVEILLFDEAQFTPIRDFTHFRQIASSYWEVEIFPNHVLPELAPYCPLIQLSPTGQIHLLDPSQYMTSLAASQRFEPSKAVLLEAPMPRALFEQTYAALSGSPYKLPADAGQGRLLALQYCQQYAQKRWHQKPRQTDKFISAALEVNTRLAKWHRTHSQKEKPMPTLTIDNVEYDIDSLSLEAKTQLKNIQFVDQELTRLQGRTAAMQTARAAYMQALKAALPAASLSAEKAGHPHDALP